MLTDEKSNTVPILGYLLAERKRRGEETTVSYRREKEGGVLHFKGEKADCELKFLKKKKKREECTKQGDLGTGEKGRCLAL